jgi:CheY-like chemotaxis protein
MDLADGVAKAIEMASPLLEERNHQLELDVPRGLTLDADPARLAQIVANLLTNAAKYTEAEGRITVSGATEGQDHVLRVTDTGVGIEPEMLPRIFDMFTQEPQSLDRARGGLGLGLTIVRNLAELHGGSVMARSAGRDRGSEFIIRLPAAQAAAASAVRDVTPETPISESERPAGTVLIVDDNPDAADMLVMYVRSLGYRVESALDGPSALRAAARLTPTIGLLDIGLPVMDGFEVARRLRSMPEHAEIRLVAITGYGQEGDRERSRAAGFDAHMVKPVDLDELRALLLELSAGKPA